MTGERLPWDKLSALYPQLVRALQDRTGPSPWHALLLVGPGGIGKRRMVELLAQALLCANSTHRPCGECTACQRVADGTHGNLLSLAPLPREKTIKIDPTRRVLDALSLHPLEQSLRVVTIPQMELMTEQAQNAVLKSLEEPDSNTVFLLTTANERALLPTVRSRCRLMRLAPWPQDETASYLVSDGVPAQEAAEWARLSGGRPLDARRLAQDPHTRDLMQLIDRTWMGLRTREDIPAASAALKGSKEDADLLLHLLEARISVLIGQNIEQVGDTPGWDTAPTLRLRRVQEKVFEARQYLASNVSWQGVADRLLIHIAKEIHQCPV